MKLTTQLALLLTLVLTSTFADDTIPGAPQTQPIALVGGIIHTVSGDTIQNGTLLFDDGKIVAAGANVAVPEGAKRIDVSGKHVYPGLFESHSQLGLTEIASTRARSITAKAAPLIPISRPIVRSTLTAL